MRVFIINYYWLVQYEFTVAKVLKLAGEYLMPLYKGITTTTFALAKTVKCVAKITLL